MKTETKAFIAVILIVAIGGAFFVLSKNKTETTDTTKTNSETVLATYSSKEVSEHKTKSDCWTIIDGDVYDITSYIPRHQGGDNILSACGIDATEFFNGEKAGLAGGTNDHGSSARYQLEKLKIGQIIN